MAIRLYNTLSGRKEPFETLNPGTVLMYVCGPTVYADAHVGHAMSVIVFDIIRRYLEFRGFTVRHVMNFTDVDDKIIQRAGQLGLDPFNLARQYIDKYDMHLRDLNILPAHIKPRATQEIEQIIDLGQRLIESGYAYPLDGDVYFRVEKAREYGKLSGRRLEDMQAGARVEIDQRKGNPMDFAIWKSAKHGEPAWASPWGPGRPGWHIECSAMSMRHLGEQIDIHGGGNDLIFPHHENEIAQTESLTGKAFARYWVHNGMLQLEGEKMSKSLGNLVTIEDFLGEHPADVFRLIVLNASYRSPLKFNAEVVEQAQRGLERILNALRPAVPQSGASEATLQTVLAEQAEATRKAFVEFMDDDFNTAGALGRLFELVRSINQARDAGASQSALSAGQQTLRELAGVFGLELREHERVAHPADPFIDLLLEIRRELRSRKLWELADSIRDRLSAAGVEIEDGRDGPTWRWR